MKFVFTKQHLINLAILILVFYGIAYFSIFFSQPFSVAKKFVEDNRDVGKSLGSLEWIIPEPFARSSSHITSQNGDAIYTLRVQGETGNGDVTINLSLNNQKWTVINATLITNKNKVVALKSESDAIK